MWPFRVASQMFIHHCKINVLVEFSNRTLFGQRSTSLYHDAYSPVSHCDPRMIIPQFHNNLQIESAKSPLCPDSKESFAVHGWYSSLPYKSSGGAQNLREPCLPRYQDAWSHYCFPLGCIPFPCVAIGFPSLGLSPFVKAFVCFSFFSFVCGV